MRTSLLLAILLAAAALSACGSAEGPAWVRLTDASVPARWRTGTGSMLVIGGQPARLVASDDEAWLEVELDPAGWTRAKRGAWSTRIPVRLIEDRRRSEVLVRLTIDGREFTQARPTSDELAAGTAFPEGSFVVTPNEVRIRSGPDAEAPRESVLSVCIRAAADTTSIRGRRFSGDGLPVMAGEAVELDVDAPVEAVLRFATTVDPLVWDAPDAGTAVTFRVLVDGVEAFSHTAASALETSYAWHAVPLSGAGRRRVTFEVEGALAYSSFFVPVVGPAEIGSFGERPWEGARPDVVLFVADTFRADNLRAYGGEGATPEIDALVPEGRLFRRAWSTSTYTLPSHTSMFSGLFPLQAGIVGFGRSVPEDVVTIAERLHAAGYRTGAITDSGAVSQTFGFAQGFEWFDERQNTMAKTIERAEAFLAGDDGRPTFLFVQSYRAHRPYRQDESITVPDDTLFQDLELPEALDEFFALEAELVEHAHDLGFTDAKRAYFLPVGVAGSPGTEEAMARLRAMYRSGSAILSRHFGRFYDRLEATGFLDDGYLVFTSDHGESFGEHGSVYHGNRTFEEELRIPLILFGGDVEPGIVEHGASLVDLSPTIADMVGLERLPEWRGTSLLALETDRPIFGFQCCASQPSGLASFAVIEGDRKVIGRYDGERLEETAELFRAYALDADPLERTSLASSDEVEWPERVFERYLPVTDELTRSIVGVEASHIDEDKAAELRALGYGE